MNVHRRGKPVSTDTINYDTPANDDGSTRTQLFFGTKSLISDIYDMNIDKQFVNTLEDNIDAWEAMSKLIN